MNANGVDARIVADAAAYSGWLSLPDATDKSYMKAPELQLRGVCN